MNGCFKHPFRFAFRGAWLAAELGLAAVTRMGLASARCSTGNNARSRWLQQHSRRVLRVLNVRLEVCGRPPPGGFLVSNHLGYLDILVLGACAPCTFVAKREVRGWPVFGWFARLAGTVFVDRGRRTDTACAVAAMRHAAGNGALVVLFPEGTSSDGASVLPFKSSLLEPLAEGKACGVAHLAYALAEGSAADEVCYWRDMTLAPHLANLLTKDQVEAQVRFASMPAGGMNRKTLALALRERIVSLGRRRAGNPFVTELAAVRHPHAVRL
jgi:1-acyl-sn-glycerol-3-phosphate acyltransferase